MDLSLIKQKLAASQTKGKPREKVDYTKIFWKPQPGKHQVRILPSKFDKSNPFREIYYHYGFAKFPILALTNWGEKDPIAEFAKQLRKSSEKDDWGLAKKIEPKVRYFAPVIIRGEEEKGARLWEFGKITYEQLLGIASDEDYGDYTNIADGRDFTIEAVDDIVMGKKSVKCSIRVKPKTTPISENGVFVEKVLLDQPDILSINKHYTFEELQDILNNWLSPEDDDDAPETAEETTSAPVATTPVNEEVDNTMPWEESEPAPVSTYTTAKVTPKPNNADKFDSLFND